MKLTSAVEISKALVQAFKNFQKDNADQLAAALAFYATFAMVPIVVITLGISGFFLETDAVKSFIFEQLSLLIGADRVPFWMEVIEKTFDTSNNIWAIIIGSLVLIFVASSFFVQLKRALNRVFNTHEIEFKGWKKFFREFVLPFLMVLGVAVLLLSVVFLQTTLTLMDEVLRGYMILPGYYYHLLISTVIIVLVFAVLYKVLAKIKLNWTAVLLAGVFAAVLLQIGIYLVTVLFSVSGILSIYSAAASLVALLYWIFFSMQIFLFGAELAFEFNEKK